MENPRQEAFKKLRGPCVELSSAGLRFRGRQANANDVLRALKPVYHVLNDLASKNVLDEKLAEYAFFPLSHIFNETQRTPSSLLELAVNCLRILIVDGWRTSLSPQMGKQLVILLTLIIGGVPNNINAGQPAHPESVELSVAGFTCLSAIFDVLGGPVAAKEIYHEIGTATVVDQTVYVMLEGISNDQADEICVSAAKATQTLFSRITDRVVLASIMPRTVSALTKVIKPTTQVRRSYNLLSICLQILTYILKVVLNDRAATVTPGSVIQPQTGDRLALDESWLNATATQIKLALTNVVQVRRHDRTEVREALLDLCLMVIEDCRTTLKDSLPIVVETMVILSEPEESISSKAFSTLKYIATAHPTVVDTLKDSLQGWITAFPRTMQGNDERAKQWASQQISVGFQVLSHIQSTSNILTNNLASGLCDSVAVTIKHANSALHPLNSEVSSSQSLDVLHSGSTSTKFSPVLLEHRSQQQTLQDIRSMIAQLSMTGSGDDITRFVINRAHHERGNSRLAPFWLSLEFLRKDEQSTDLFDEFISDDQLQGPALNSTRSSMIEELYYISLPILNDMLPDEPMDWRISALALEAVALQAQQLGEGFRPELMEALYPVLQLLASGNPNLQKHSMTCLNILTLACKYESTSTMIIENVDYLVNSVTLKLNIFDVSPYPPRVLFMMVKLCGVRLIPYLDDVVDTIFGVLDLYHGYPKLVEMMFKALAAIVEEGAKRPGFLAIDDGKKTNVDHRKRGYEKFQISTLAQDFAKRRAKRAKYSDDTDEKLSHPKQPWTTKSEKAEEPDLDINSQVDAIMNEGSDEQLPPPREPEDSEKPLSKSHALLLHIIKSIPLHLSSPSPYLRRSLLSILIQIAPTLAGNENSFLPLVNDVWPSVAARIRFPLSVESSSSSNALMTKDNNHETPEAEKQTHSNNEFTFREETFVATTACKAIETICKTAGDFTASRVETEFSRWERLYRRAWSQVRQDAEKALARRQAQQQKPPTLSDPSSPEPRETQPNAVTSSSSLLPLIPSLSLSASGPSSSTPGAGGSRAFTPHHSLWRALISLFLMLLTHVRLPLSIGDTIVKFLAAWISRFAGPEFYFSRLRNQTGTASDNGNDNNEQNGEDSSSARTVRSIENAIQAMETWNADLTWFVFVKQREEVRAATAAAAASNAKQRTTVANAPKIVEVVEEEPMKKWRSPGGMLRFAEPVV